MKESCCQFGEDHHLAGIVTEPLPSTSQPRGMFVLLNAGLVPKAGPFRLYADLARRLAGEGFVTLRFDLGGIGDSRQEHAGRPLRERTERDVRAALDWLIERYDPNQIVLGGLCSGAEDAFRAAEQDPRVTGVVLVDPFAYRTAGFFPRHLAHRVARRVRRAFGLYKPLARPKAAASGRDALVDYAYMTRAESTQILRTLVERRVHTHFVYTGGARESFNHPEQLRAMFSDVEFDGLVTVDHMPELEHTQLLAADRLCLVEAIVERLGWAETPFTPRSRHEETRESPARPPPAVPRA
jgi:dienelactone hydrolase